MAPALTLKLANMLQAGSGEPERRDLLASLTERERQILEHLARGESNKTIARALDISHDTVKLHVRHILTKLNLNSRVEAAVFAVEQARRRRAAPAWSKALGERHAETGAASGWAAYQSSTSRRPHHLADDGQRG